MSTTSENNKRIAKNTFVPLFPYVAGDAGKSLYESGGVGHVGCGGLWNL